MRPAFFRDFLLANVLILASANALSCPSTFAQDMALTCHVTYAGETQTLAICPTHQPYGHESVNIGHRFRFKAVHVKDENLSPRIGIYVYFEDKQQSLLIQHVQIRPPFPSPKEGELIDLMGEQHLYAGPLERELIYRCVAGKNVP